MKKQIADFAQISFKFKERRLSEAFFNFVTGNSGAVHQVSDIGDRGGTPIRVL